MRTRGRNMASALMTSAWNTYGFANNSEETRIVSGYSGCEIRGGGAGALIAVSGLRVCDEQPRVRPAFRLLRQQGSLRTFNNTRKG